MPDEADFRNAADFLALLNSAVRSTNVRVDDVGGHDKQLTLVDAETGHSLFGSNSYLRWVNDQYEIETY